MQRRPPVRFEPAGNGRDRARPGGELENIGGKRLCMRGGVGILTARGGLTPRDVPLGPAGLKCPMRNDAWAGGDKQPIE